MSNLLQGLKFENKTVNLIKEENSKLESFKDMLRIYEDATRYVGVIGELRDKIDRKIRIGSSEIRNNKWVTNRKLPKNFRTISSCKGDIIDSITALDLLPKVKISEIRKLADSFNMVIIPVEYSETDKLFDTQSNSRELKQGLRYFNELLRQDVTTKYQTYMLCPIDYYNVWEQIKSDVVKDIYYADYFESVFGTLDLLIPSQKNLYLATKTNDENLKSIALSFDTNIKTLNSKINNVSAKVNKLETEFINEKKKTEEFKARTKEKEEALQSTILKQQQEIAFLYKNIDPVLFAIPSDVNIVDDECTSIVGLCWGADIDDMIFDMKGITIEHKDLKKIDPIGIESTMRKMGFSLDYDKIIDYKEHLTNKLNSVVNSLNKKRYSNGWDYRSDRIYRPFSIENHTFKFEYKDFTRSDDGKMYIAYIYILDSDGNAIKTLNTVDYCRDYQRLEKADSDTRFLEVYQRVFDTLINEYCKLKSDREVA